MKVNIKDREYFKDNVATYRDLGELQILDFKVPGKFYKSLRYIFDGNKMYVSGDYGSAVFELTWHGTPWNFNVDIGYFREKLAAYHEDKTSFNSDRACENLEEYYQEFKNDNFDSISNLEEELKNQEAELVRLKEIREPNENEIEKIKDNIEFLIKDLEEKKEDQDYIMLKEIFDRLKDRANGCNSCSEWAQGINYCDELEELSNWDCDYWEWIYGIGDDIPKRVEIYLIGLTLASQQLQPIE